MDCWAHTSINRSVNETIKSCSLGNRLHLVPCPVRVDETGNFAPIRVGHFANEHVRRDMEPVQNVWQRRNEKQGPIGCAASNRKQQINAMQYSRNGADCIIFYILTKPSDRPVPIGLALRPPHRLGADGGALHVYRRSSVRF